MKNPYLIIQNQKKVIENLKYKFKFSNNKKQDADDINALIDTIELFELHLNNKYKIDALESVIYTLIKEILMQHKVWDNQIPIHQITKTIDDALTYGKDVAKQEVVDLLKSHELTNKINDLTLFNSEYTNFDILLNKLMREFKYQIVWKG